MKRFYVFLTFIIAAYLTISGCATVPKSPLIEAASKGDSITAQKLIKEGANVNEQDKRGDTPLMHAIWSGKVETVKTLINMGADINTHDSYYGYTPLLTSVMYNYIDISKLLINKGADINARGNDGSSSLILAIGINNNELANLLIDKGAETNIQDRNGLTPLIQAAANGNIEIVKRLIEKKVDVFAVDSSGYRALDYAKFAHRPVKQVFKSAENVKQTELLIQILKEAEDNSLKAGYKGSKNQGIGRLISITRQVSGCMMPDVDYAVYINQAKEANAFVNLSGNITFTSGAMEKWDDDVIIFVAAHEIAHDKLGHVSKKMAVSYVTTGAFIVAGFFVPGIGLLNHAVNPAITRNFSKTQEYEADKLASDYCLKCFNMTIEKQLNIMAHLKNESKNDGGGFWSTHPSWDDRSKNIQK